MFNDALGLTKIVHLSDITNHLDNGWVKLYLCNTFGQAL